MTSRDFDREVAIVPHEDAPRCQCGHRLPDHDLGLFGATCRGNDPSVPEWVRVVCKCRDFREAKA